MTPEKIRQLDEEIQKLRKKIQTYQKRLEQLEAKKTEAENLEIIRAVRSLNVSPEKLKELLKSIDPMKTEDDENEDL